MPFSPYDAATHAVGRARALLRESRTSNQLGTPTLRGDLRRLSVVMAVSALDTYMHRLIVERVFREPDLPPALARLDVSFAQLLNQADETGVAARSEPKNIRPRVGVKRQLRDRLLRETFQRFDDVGQALAMARQAKNWKAIGQQFQPPLTADEIRERLDRIVTRRNQIVHEGDYERLERPRGSRRNGISQSQAQSDVSFIENLIDAIHAVVSRP